MVGRSGSYGIIEHDIASGGSMSRFQSYRCDSSGPLGMPACQEPRSEKQVRQPHDRCLTDIILPDQSSECAGSNTSWLSNCSKTHTCDGLDMHPDVHLV